MTEEGKMYYDQWKELIIKEYLNYYGYDYDLTTLCLIRYTKFTSEAGTFCEYKMKRFIYRIEFIEDNKYENHIIDWR